ncbi:Armadillo-like helical [Quillaja saponaria]|uniref:Armadillo-like helical n=1 Tax=Quillaja saponaria TaxID=32244 RepID=A0AAD7LIG3_QUISA|nr:Armadillo-like helical [Quillaja saponaria]
MEDLDPSKEDSPRVLKVLKALKQASHELQTHPSHKSHECNSTAIKALLELENESDTILSKDPNLSALSQHLTDLKTLVESLQKSRGHSLRSFLSRRVSTHSISRIAGSIESEIQAWIDRESVEKLTQTLEDPLRDEGKLVAMLIQFEDRVSQGFNRELQDLVLKSKLFSLLESVLSNPNCSKRIREHSAFGIAALIQFNKDVFVGQVLMGPTVRVLIAMASTQSIEVLCSLIRSIKSPLVDEIESNGEIPKIISFLNWQDLQMRVLGMDCVLEIGYFGRKEAIEAMLKEDLIKKLVELQRSELGGDLIDLGRHSEKENREASAGGFVGRRESEGLRQRERRALKPEIVKRVREASISDAEAATIVAEVLWGSSP